MGLILIDEIQQSDFFTRLLGLVLVCPSQSRYALFYPTQANNRHLEIYVPCWSLLIVIVPAHIVSFYILDHMPYLKVPF